MTTFLDLLIVVVLALAAISLVAMTLQFLVKNRTVKRICLYIVAALGIYMGYVGCRILWPGFAVQAALAVLAALVSIAAVVLERRSHDSKGKLLTAQIMASASLIVGMFNAFL